MEAESTHFDTGKLVATPTALRALESNDIVDALHRHCQCDWGDLGHGARLFSAYKKYDGPDFWIITEADRSVTTILLPEDY